MLDTNTCIHLIKHRPQHLLNRFERTAVGDVGVSSITLAELEYGVAKSGWPDKNRTALRNFVAPLEVAAWDQTVTVAYGKIRALLERKGTLIGAMDLLIAAHAVSLSVQLITTNVIEFKRVPGLRTANWV